MIVYRLSKAKYSSTIDGKGAAEYPGRWNKTGVPALYTSASPSLALLEILVNFEDWRILAATPYVLLSIKVPDAKIKHLPISALPKNWNSSNVGEETQMFGSRMFAKSSFAGFSVPSAVLQTERNFILNPKSENYEKEIKIVSAAPFSIDRRLTDRYKKLV